MQDNSAIAGARALRGDRLRRPDSVADDLVVIDPVAIVCVMTCPDGASR